MESKHKLGLMMAMFGVFAMNPERRRTLNNEDVLNNEPPTPETDQERAKRLGLKEWTIDGITVYSATKSKALKLIKRLDR